MITWHIGCSGFHYKHWKETFYPKGFPQRRWFEYYAEFFNTLELNVTFYRFPNIGILSNWYEKSSAEFLFAVKVPRIITHYKKLNDCQRLLTDFYHNLSAGLKEKTGCVLFQFPPMFDYTDERLEKILNNVDKSFPNVVEFRHSSWWNENVYKILSENNISFSGMSHPKLPQDVIANAPLLYYRMHGVPQLYRSLYSKKQLEDLKNEIQSKPIVQHAFIYFNNDNEANAVANARQLLAIVKQS